MDAPKKLVEWVPLPLFLILMLLFTACSAATLEIEQQPAASSIDIDGEAPFEPIGMESDTSGLSVPSAAMTPGLDEPTVEIKENANESEGAKQQEDRAQSEAQEAAKQRMLPEGFVYLDDVIPSAQYRNGYYNDHNFVGARIDGYLAPFAIATVEAAEALRAVGEEMAASGYQLVIYDAYRPQKAVDHFIRWSQDAEDIAMKESFYPNEGKDELFQLGYLARRSGHSRGSTIDLTLASAETGEEIDMGGPVDLLDERSHFATKQITEEQAANRSLLKDVMSRHGFKPYSKEWWHYTLKDEPYPDTYFDFDVE